MFIRSFILFLIVPVAIYATNYSQTIKDKKIYPMGEKIYTKKCSDISTFSSKVDLEVKIQKSCKKLKPKHSEALHIYLWDKKQNTKSSSIKMIKVDKKDKCQVCGMWVYKYPKWVAQIQMKKSHLSFDGVKDLMKYYFNHINIDAKIVVRDYYSQKPLDARKSFFVLGSDVYGPMGKELIPFSSLEDAQTFMMDHKAKKIVKFSEISKADLY